MEKKREKVRNCLNFLSNVFQRRYKNHGSKCLKYLHISSLGSLFQKLNLCDISLFCCLIKSVVVVSFLLIISLNSTNCNSLLPLGVRGVQSLIKGTFSSSSNYMGWGGMAIDPLYNQCF